MQYPSHSNLLSTHSNVFPLTVMCYPFTVMLYPIIYNEYSIHNNNINRPKFGPELLRLSNMAELTKIVTIGNISGSILTFTEKEILAFSITLGQSVLTWFQHHSHRMGHLDTKNNLM